MVAPKSDGGRIDSLDEFVDAERAADAGEVHWILSIDWAAVNGNRTVRIARGFGEVDVRSVGVDVCNRIWHVTLYADPDDMKAYEAALERVVETVRCE